MQHLYLKNRVVKHITSLVLLIALLLTVCFFPICVRAASNEELVPLRTSISDFVTGRRIPGTSRFTFYAHVDFGATSFKHMNDALWEWNHHLPDGIEWVYRDPTQRHSAENYPAYDSYSRIYRQDIGWDEYVAEITLMPYSSTITTEADMNINMYHNWVNSAQPNAYDFWTVFLHEAGHLYGLCDIYDSVYSSRIMYGIAPKNATKRTVTSAEAYILQTIYS